MSISILKCFASRYFHIYTKECYILTYIDLDELFTKEKIVKYIREVIEQNKILSKKIIEISNNHYLIDAEYLNIDEHYSVVHAKHEDFDNYTKDIFNTKIETFLKWKFVWFVDETLLKTRMYFKINHSYVDGYTLINILTSPFKHKDVTSNFKRKANNILDQIYYYIIGTIVVIILTIQVCINNIVQKMYKHKEEITEDFSTTKDDYIICESFNLSDIKIFTKKQNITINDFLYSLMIKTDNKYRKKEKLLTTMFPINVSGITQPTNELGIYNVIKNSMDNYSLLKNVNNTFNCLKFSLYIPIVTFLINKIDPFLFINNYINDLYTCNIDYVFTNMIGPDIKNFETKITDIHFLCNNLYKEVIYSIISCNNNINIICSFKEGIIEDKKEYEKCIYESYNEIMKL